ncbi:MAG: hypothetical protein R3A12_11565 [Ignavibacteria bacterium]
MVVIIGQVTSCSLGCFLAGNDAKTSVKVGMGLGQIGEFSFIIAALGLSLNVTSDFIYPIAVAVSAITTLTTPYQIEALIKYQICWRGYLLKHCSEQWKLIAYG